MSITPPKIIRIAQVVALTGLARPTIYKLLRQDPSFPRQVSLTNSDAKGAPVGWVLDEVNTWLNARVDARSCARVETRIPASLNDSTACATELRDYFAAKAMQAYLMHSDNQEANAKRAYSMADAMLVMRRLKL